MEWTGQQQIEFLLLSIGLGVAQGLAFDVVDGLLSIPKRKRWLWRDVVFGPIAAMVTFFGALVLMDGHLHPLLLFGTVFGMVIEHWLFGVWVCRFLRCTRCVVRKWLGSGCRFLHRVLVGLIGRVKRMGLRGTKRPKNDTKT